MSQTKVAKNLSFFWCKIKNCFSPIKTSITFNSKRKSGSKPTKKSQSYSRTSTSTWRSSTITRASRSSSSLIRANDSLSDNRWMRPKIGWKQGKMTAWEHRTRPSFHMRSLTPDSMDLSDSKLKLSQWRPARPTNKSSELAYNVLIAWIKIYPECPKEGLSKNWAPTIRRWRNAFSSFKKETYSRFRTSKISQKSTNWSRNVQWSTRKSKDSLS